MGVPAYQSPGAGLANVAQHLGVDPRCEALVGLGDRSGVREQHVLCDLRELAAGVLLGARRCCR